MASDFSSSSLQSIIFSALLGGVAWAAVSYLYKRLQRHGFAWLESSKHKRHLGQLDNKQFSYEGIFSDIFVVDVCKEGYLDENLSVRVHAFESIEVRRTALSESDPVFARLFSSYDQAVAIWNSQKGSSAKIVYDHFDLVGVDRVEVDSLAIRRLMLSDGTVRPAVTSSTAQSRKLTNHLKQTRNPQS